MKIAVVTRLAIDPLSDAAQSLRIYDSKLMANRWRSEKWFEERLAIFTKCALRSMFHQTRRPDRWVIAIDELHSSRFREHELEIPGFAQVLILGPGDEFAEVLRSALGDLGRDLLTIRFDSDDLIHRRFVELAGKFARPNHGINFPHGLQFYWPSGVLVHRWIRSNPTVGFRATGSPTHVHDFGQHRIVGEKARMVSIPTLSPMYIKTSHANNHVPFQPNGLPVLRTRGVYRVFALDRFAFPLTSQSRFATLVSYLGFRLNKFSPRTAVRLEHFRRSLKQSVS